MLANLLAMPIVPAWVMLAGCLALLALPFGFDAPLWKLMGVGIQWMIAVALWVTQLPGSVGRVAAFGVGPLLLGSGGLLVVCLLRSPLRFAGATRVAISAFARRARLAEAYGQPTSPTRWRYGRHHEDQQRFIRRA